MRGKTSHATKTLADRTNYQKALAKVDTEPTIDESIDFKQSNKMDEEKEGNVLAKKRPISFGKKIVKIISEHSVELFLAILSVSFVFAGYLLYESKAALSSIEKDIEIQQQQLNRLSTAVDDNDSESKEQIQLIQSDLDKLRDKIENSNEVNHTQDVTLAEIKLKIEFMLEKINQQK